MFQKDPLEAELWPFLISIPFIEAKRAFFRITCFKDRHQWWGREFRCSLSLDMDKLFPKAILYIVHH